MSELIPGFILSASVENSEIYICVNSTIMDILPMVARKLSLIFS